MVDDLRENIVKTLRNTDDTNLSLGDFSEKKVYNEDYSIEEFLNDVSKELEKSFSEIISEERSIKDLSLNDIYANVIEESEVSSGLFITYLLVINKDGKSIRDFIRDIFDNINNNLVSKIMDCVFEVDEIPVFMKVAFETTLPKNNSSNEYKELKNHHLN